MIKYLAKALIGGDGQIEKRNMSWNMIGSFLYALASMVLTIAVIQIVGEDEGGIFSFAYSTFGQHMFMVAYFGIRPFQITDTRRRFTFGEYLRLRLMTCGAALVAGLFYVTVINRDYAFVKAATVFLMVAYKVIDGFADAYEAEFQRDGRLYLTGKSNAFRTVLSVGVFLGSLNATHNLVGSCLAAVLAQLAGVCLFDFSVIGHLSQVDWEVRSGRVGLLFKENVVLFLSVILDFYIFSAAKYAIDAHLGDAASGYFNVIFMPTSVINLAAGFVIRPFLTYLTDCWNEHRFSDFKKKLLTIMAVIGGLTVLAVGGTVVFGRPVLALLEWLLGKSYSGTLTALWPAFIMIVLGGGFYAVLNLYYYALVILRRQKLIFGIYAVLTVLAAILAPRLTVALGIFGAALAYLILMIVMAAGFVGGAWFEIQKEIREVRHDS